MSSIIICAIVAILMVMCYKFGYIVAASTFVWSRIFNNFGENMQFAGGSLYYASNIPANDVIRLGEFLVFKGIFDGNKKSLRIKKYNSQYELRMIVPIGYHHDAEIVETCSSLAHEISDKIFEGNKLNVILCDMNFKTVNVVS
jgi:hypothetical protein